MADLFNLELEKYAIASLIKHPHLFDQVELFIKANDFHFEVNRRLFEVTRSLILQNKTPDSVLVAAKIKELGVTLPNGVQAHPYLQALELIPITEKSGLQYFQELAALSFRRNYLDNLRDCAKIIKSDDSNSIEELVSKVDGVYNKYVNTFDVFDQPVNLFTIARETIADRINNPEKSVSYLTPFPEFNDLYGGLRPKNLYCFGSRAGSGKTTLLANLGFKTANICNDKKLNLLYLDTEMEDTDSALRTIAALTGIPFNSLDQGKITKEWKNKIDGLLDVADKEYKFDFLKVGNKSTDQVVSIVRRWYNSKVGRGNDCIICYDYLKLVNEPTTDSSKEFQLMGDKVDKFKKLAEEINAIWLTAVQLNRTAENQGKKEGTYSTNQASISLSDRISWFASFVALFQRKTMDQISMDGPEFGSHSMHVVKARFNGPKAPGFFDIVERVMDGKKQYVQNYLSFDVKNFDVREIGSLQTIINKGKNKVNIQNNSTEDESVF